MDSSTSTLGSSSESPCHLPSRTVLISGSSNLPLAESIAKILKCPLLDRVAEPFSSGEPHVEILSNVRDRDVVIIQSVGRNVGGRSTNYYFMELVFMIDACTRSNARSVTVVTPLYPYARQDKKDRPRVPISAKVVADILEDVGTNRLITMDLHAAQIQGFFKIPVDNIYAINEMCAYLSTFVNPEEYVLVSPDNGGSKRVDAYSEKLHLRSVIMHKSRDHTKASVVTKSILVGDVDDLEGRTAIIVDDMLDTGGTMVRACETLAEFGLTKIIVVITHGILSGPAVERLEGCEAITEVVTTNTLPMEPYKEFSKLKVIDVSHFFASVIECIFTGDSVSKFFE